MLDSEEGPVIVAPTLTAFFHKLLVAGASVKAVVEASRD